jgi:hypothetical protein
MVHRVEVNAVEKYKTHTRVGSGSMLSLLTVCAAAMLVGCCLPTLCGQVSNLALTRASNLTAATSPCVVAANST